MKRWTLAVLTAAVLIMVPSGLAQETGAYSLPDPDCSTRQKALTWWADRNETVMQAAEPVRNFWDSVRPLLQLNRIEDPGPLCDVLYHLLSASEVEPVPGTQEVVAASNASERLPEKLASPAKPAIDSVARSVGGRMLEQVNASESTPKRIRLLKTTHRMYNEAGLAGAGARVGLRLDTWQTMWRLDVDRTERHLDRAREIGRRINTSVVTPVEMASIPSLTQSLEVDRRIMADHLDTSGDSTPSRIQQIDAAVSGLRTLHADALVSNLGVTVGIMVATVGIVALLRFPIRFLERDVSDLEDTLRGVSP